MNNIKDAFLPKFSMKIREIYNQTRDVLKNRRKSNFVKMSEKENSKF